MWVIRKLNHKSSGLSARVINCMSSSKQLPARARAKIIEYVAEKAAGLYGHHRAQRRRFVAQLNAELVQRVHSQRTEFRQRPTLKNNGPASRVDAPCSIAILARKSQPESAAGSEASDPGIGAMRRNLAATAERSARYC